MDPQPGIVAEPTIVKVGIAPTSELAATCPTPQGPKRVLPQGAVSQNAADLTEFEVACEANGPTRMRVNVHTCAGPHWSPFMGQVDLPVCSSLGQIREALVNTVEKRPCWRRRAVRFVLPCGKEL